MFGSYLAVGVTMFLVAQAVINMSVAIGMLPAKGLPLPFVSYGGSALVAGLLASGVLLNVSQYGS
jgi:cell division protein FtsW